MYLKESPMGAELITPGCEVGEIDFVARILFDIFPETISSLQRICQ